MKGLIAFLLVIIIALLAVIAWESHRGQIKVENPWSQRIPVFSIGDLFDPESMPERGQTIQVDNGIIVSIETLTPSLRFQYATQSDPSKVILVESSRNPPENFRVGITASIKGTYDPNGKVFKAYQVSTNFPSRYDPKEELKKIDASQKDDSLPE
jgi:cytochrome c-type biogenesis protein CcmE